MLNRLIKSVVAISLVFLFSSAAIANTSVEQIKRRAAEINEMKSLLQSADPALRLAAIDTMQNSQDLAMRELGFSAGLQSSDEAVVALTIRNKFTTIDNFIISLIKPEKDENKIKIYDGLGGRILYNIRSYDKARGKISTNYSGQSTISGLNFFIGSESCRGEFKLADDLVYRGIITCENQQIKAEINIF